MKIYAFPRLRNKLQQSIWQGREFIFVRIIGQKTAVYFEADYFHNACRLVNPAQTERRISSEKSIKVFLERAKRYNFSHFTCCKYEFIYQVILRRRFPSGQRAEKKGSPKNFYGKEII